MIQCLEFLDEQQLVFSKCSESSSQKWMPIYQDDYVQIKSLKDVSNPKFLFVDATELKVGPVPHD